VGSGVYYSWPSREPLLTVACFQRRMGCSGVCVSSLLIRLKFANVITPSSIINALLWEVWTLTSLYPGSLREVGGGGICCCDGVNTYKTKSLIFTAFKSQWSRVPELMGFQLVMPLTCTKSLTIAHYPYDLNALRWEV